MIDLHSSNDWVRSLRLAAGIALCAASVSAQTGLPNFSGTWEPISVSDPLATAAVQTVRQTETVLTVGHDSSMAGHKFVYKLDGSENHSTLMNIESTARVSVDGNKLTINRVDAYPDGRIRENRQVWSLDPKGNLVIEATDGTRGETTITRKLVYKKRLLSKN